MGHAVERFGRGKQRTPYRASCDLAPAGAFALAPALAEHACHFAAGDDLWTCRQQIFQQRAAAVAIASDIDKLGHFGPCATASMRGEAGRLCHFPRQNTSPPRHDDGTGPPCLPRRLALLRPLPYKLATEIGERGSDVFKRCRW